MIVFDDGLEGATPFPMIQLHLGQTRCIKGSGVFPPRGVDKFSFLNKQKLRIGVNKAPDQPGTGYAVYLDVAARNPLHATPRMADESLEEPRQLQSRRQSFDTTLPQFVQGGL